MPSYIVMSMLKNYVRNSVFMGHNYRTVAAAAGLAIDRAWEDDLDKFSGDKARLRRVWYYLALLCNCSMGYGWALQLQTVKLSLWSIAVQFDMRTASDLTIQSVIPLWYLCDRKIKQEYNIWKKFPFIVVAS